MLCVQFRIPDNELVRVGKYNAEKLEITASEAAAAFLKHTDPMGLEAIVPRRIMPKETNEPIWLRESPVGATIRLQKAKSHSVTVNSVIAERYELSA